MSNIPQEQVPDKDNQPDVSTMSIEEILKHPDWRDLIAIKFPGCDLSLWTLKRNRILSGEFEKSQRRNRSTSTGKPRGKTNYAAAVISSGEAQRLTVYGAMAEQVERVNGEGDE